MVEQHTEAALNLNVHASGTLAKEAGGSALLSEAYTLRIQDAQFQVLNVYFSIYIEQKYKRNNFKDFTESQFIEGNRSIEIHFIRA